MVNKVKIINIIKIIIMAVIEGITEWLPISSTGHMLIIEKYLNVKHIFTIEKFYDLFLVLIQLGAVFAVISKYFKKLNPFKQNERKENFQTWVYIVIATIPAGIVGFLFDDLLFTNFYHIIIVSITLIIYGIIFLFIDKIKLKKQKLNLKTAFLIGIMQILALIPGTSRSGIMIIAGIIFLGDKTKATEFSFMCSIPIIFGASLLKTYKYLINYKIIITDLILLLIGMIIAFIISKIILNKLIKYVEKNSLKNFGIYRIILGLLIFIILLV